MSGVQKCTLRRYSERCATSQGLALAARWFGMDEAAVEAAAGRFTKGNQKGRLRGWVIYNECTVGGWCYPLQCVIRPGMKFGQFAKTWDEFTHIMNLSTELFMAGAKRVDTCYGHNPLAAAAVKEQRPVEYASTAARISARNLLNTYKEAPAAWAVLSVRGCPARKALATGLKMVRNGKVSA